MVFLSNLTYLTLQQLFAYRLTETEWSEAYLPLDYCVTKNLYRRIK